MKPIMLIIILTFSFLTKLNAQKIEIDKIDEFENVRLISTNVVDLHGWLYSEKTVFRSGIAFSSIGKQIQLRLFLSQSNVFSVSTSDYIQLKLKNGEVLKFGITQLEISSSGGAAYKFMGSVMQGVTIVFPIEIEDIDKIKKHGLSLIRVSLRDGVDDGIVNDKNNAGLSKLIEVFLDRYQMRMKEE